MWEGYRKHESSGISIFDVTEIAILCDLLAPGEAEASGNSRNQLKKFFSLNRITGKGLVQNCKENYEAPHNKPT